jgi:hypothetical protein
LLWQEATNKASFNINININIILNMMHRLINAGGKRREVMFFLGRSSGLVIFEVKTTIIGLIPQLHVV